ncbi:Soluble lytic murein transglycosylase precursor [hydrothermal vent metagenome]|uniref:Soluble lytic murein transglycosylase n=1 Tax=hydrothermal vent metagenome TaxID=652676 RepID=A0A3B0ZCP7_9ZZZZ
MQSQVKNRFAKAGLILLALSLTQSGNANTLDRQRDQFIKAESALKANRKSHFRQLKQKLFAYPLYGYLDFWELKRRLGKAKPDEVREFFQLYNGQPIATRLRSSWLHKLARRGDWENYLVFYWPQTSVTLQCYEIHARLKLGLDRETALNDAMKLWMVGYSQPDACNPVFKQLVASSQLTSADIWQRVRLAFANQKSSLAAYLAKKLSAEDREWVNRWYHAHRRPTAAISTKWARDDTPLVREILTHAIKRLARHKPAQAYKHWQALRSNHHFTKAQNADVLGRIALTAALANHPDAARWLAEVPDSAVDRDIRQWRVRNALMRQDPADIKHWIKQLPAEERNEAEWRYWFAWAQEQSGAKGDAFTTYASLGEQRNYYGFLASDKLGRPYHMNDARTVVDKKQFEELTLLPGLQRAQELYFVGKRLDARREWFHTTSSLNPEQLKYASLLAHRWGWHDRAIITAAQARSWNDLTLRFPLPHRESIFSTAAQYNLDPALIYGVIRQESAFMEDAHSTVGALGLMQLMPATGRQTARSLNIRYGGNRALLKSGQNIRLGSAYLNHLMTRFNGSPVLAAAAYNAGPHRVSRWLPGDRSLPAALWMENIPYRETRNYVKQVLAYATIFDWRLSQPLTRLSQRLPDVQERY